MNPKITTLNIKIMSKFKILLVVLFAAFANINLSYAQWSAITGNNTLTINGTAVGVGTSTQTKKFEIWDGTTAGKFTFSAPSCTTSYEASQTLDDTGYKLNVGLLSRNYKIALNGTDRFKLLSNDNVGIGTNSLSGITTAINNIGLGTNSLKTTTTGDYNIAIGYSSLFALISGTHNVAMGNNSLYNTTTGNYNTGIGPMTLNVNQTGSYNSALGYSAGTSYTNSTYSVYIGASARSQADNQTNQIVIGNNAVGNGSNTVTLGNDNITGTFLKGKVGIGTLIPNALLQVGNSFSDTGTQSLRISTAAGATGSVVDALHIDTYNSGNFDQGVGISFGLKSTTYGYYTSRIVHFGNTPNTRATKLQFQTHSATDGIWNIGMLIDDSGRIGIGLTNPDEMLTVNGIIHAKEVKVDMTGSLADFVFKPTYKLMPLNQVEQYVNTNSHLPEMPSAAEVSKNGLNMGEMQNKLLQKVEELTLYMIDQQKTINLQSAKIEELERKLK